MGIIEIRSQSEHSAYAFPVDEVAYVSIDKGGPRRFPRLEIALRSGRVIQAVAAGHGQRQIDKYNTLVGLYTDITNGMGVEDLTTYEDIGVVRSEERSRDDWRAQRWAESRKMEMEASDED